MKHRPLHVGRAGTVVFTLAGLGLATTALLWGWNTFAVEMLAKPSMQFKHALALEILLAALAALAAAPLLAWRAVAAGRPARRQTA